MVTKKDEVKYPAAVDSAVKRKANQSVPPVVSRKVFAHNKEVFPILFIDDTAPSSETLPSSSTVSISSDQALPASGMPVSVPTIRVESSNRVHIASEPGRSDAVPLLSRSLKVSSSSAASSSRTTAAVKLTKAGRVLNKNNLTLKIPVMSVLRMEPQVSPITPTSR